MTSPAIILLGVGGHASVLVDVIQLLGYNILGYTNPIPIDDRHFIDDLTYLGPDEQITQHSINEIQLVNGLGSVGPIIKRKQLFQYFTQLGYSFANLCHPSAIISTSHVHCDQGLQALANSVINTHSIIGTNVILNTGAIIEHHCTIGDHCHIAPGAVVCGHCRIGDAVHVGANATINQGILIGNGAVIASGSVVISDVKPGQLMTGVPATVKKTYE